jgi:hypothetical protein
LVDVEKIGAKTPVNGCLAQARKCLTRSRRRAK